MLANDHPLIQLRRRPALRLLAVAIVLAFGAVLWAAPAHAATITVTTMDDENNSDGDCSLREAVRAANSNQPVDACAAGSGDDTIVVPAGTYVFNPTLGGAGENTSQSGDLDLFTNITIIGAGRNQTVIDADEIDRVFDVLSGATVTIRDLTITGGDAHGGHGGGVQHVSGTLTLSNVRVTGNTTGGTTTFNGGGVFTTADSGLLNISFSRIDNNSSVNMGGGVYADDNTLMQIRSTRIHNNAAPVGGGVNNRGTTTIRSSEISLNTATSTASGGGGINSNSTLFLINSTLSLNAAAGSGGGMVVASSSSASLYNVTITANTADSNVDNTGDGGGIRIASGTVFFRNSIIAGNSDASAITDHPDCSGTYESVGYNLIGDTTGCTITGQTATNITGQDAKLGFLEDNGGATFTHSLKAGSPAIDAGNPAGCKDESNLNLTVDQRGFARPVNGNLTADITCDMGAFERLSPGPPTPTVTPPATSSPTASATATASPTPSKTATATATSTIGPSPTPSKTPTPSATPTDGPSPTPTKTLEPTKTPPPTATATEGPSPMPSATPTEGPSPTPSATATAGPSPTPSATATAEPSPTPFVPSHWLYLPVAVDE